MEINLELLRTFVVCAGSRTFAEAARSRFVTKSAVSQQIKTLEQQLGVALFERVGRNARLTPSGSVLAEVLRRELDAIDAALEAAIADEREVAGTVRLGSPRPFARIWLRPRLARLLAGHRRLRVDVDFDGPTALERRLVAGELDLAILVRPPTSALVATAPIYEETFAAYASPEYLRDRGVPNRAGDFAGHRWIAFDRDLPMQASWWRACFGRNARLRGEIACFIASLDEMLALAEAGLGIAVLPSYFAAEAASRNALTDLRPNRRRAANTIYLAWRANAAPTARLRTVRDALLGG